MSNPHGRSSWNKHKWPKETTWWDDLEVDTSALSERGISVFDWLEEAAPDPYEHDYILYTDGSGCSAGYGGYAAVIEKVDLKGEERDVVDSWALAAATYGSTVQRCEFTAMLEGVHHILKDRVEEIHNSAINDEELKYRLGTEGHLQQIMGPERIRILWYTDRLNLAKALLFDENGDPLNPRTTERDLWMRWSFMAKHLCVTPMHRARNVVQGQAICDGLAGAGRGAMLTLRDKMASISQQLIQTEKWQKKLTQVARF